MARKGGKRTTAAHINVGDLEFQAVPRNVVNRRAVPEMLDLHKQVVETAGIPDKQIRVTLKGKENPRDLVRLVRSVIRKNGHRDISVFAKIEPDAVILWAGPVRKRSSNKKKPPVDAPLGE